MMHLYRKVMFLAIFVGLIVSSAQVFAASINAFSAAIGPNCTASGTAATCMGTNTTASGYASTAMGFSAEATEEACTAIGYSTTASGKYATAMGYHAAASGKYSTAMGYYSHASGMYSTTMGYYTLAGGEVSWAGGKFMKLSAEANHTFVWGHSDTAKTITTANAFLIFPEGTAGRVGIGTSKPNEPLELAGNGRAFFGDGGGSSRRGLLIDGINAPNAARLEAYDYGTTSGMDLAINTVGNGNVGIGTIDPGQKLDIKGGNGRVESGYNWLTNSDVRLKKNISALENSLEKICRLRGVRFDINESHAVEKSKGKHIGVIAQELEKEYPELVVGDKTTGYKAVAYDKLTAVLIEAVKELKDQNEKQKEEIKRLRLMIEDLKS